jgi:potassium-transporting ATPase potassium-binding subunit
MAQGFLQIAILLVVLVAVGRPLGGYMARVFRGERTFMDPIAGPLERGTYRLLRVDPDRQQDWKGYARSLLIFSGLFWLVLYLILRTQTIQPFNPEAFHSGTWDLSFNTTSSFVTNTNWQYYGGETTLSYFSQMTGLAVQNFVSAAVGIAVAIALVRGIAGRRTEGPVALGNFWRDTTRAIYYVLLPISLVAALVLVSQGVVQTLGHYVGFHGLGGFTGQLALGPVASQEAIKELGTNGGGFFNVNSAMPFENPNGLTNFLEMFLLLLIPVALTFTFGRMVGNRRQGYALLGAMSLLLVVGIVVAFAAEQHGTVAQHAAGVHTTRFHGSTGGNLEGKEVRYGIANSALWAVITTATSCGAVNAAMESFTGLGSLVPLSNLSMSESVFGGVGAGLYTMLLFVLLAVFIGGLMVGRTPEYLGKKIEAREIKLISLAVLITPLLILAATGLASALPAGKQSLFAQGPQGFSETLYAYSSQANNNGSAFAGYTGYIQPHPGNVGAHGIAFADIAGGLVMLIGRFLPIVIILAVAGSLGGKRVTPPGLGTMRTDTPTFVVLLIGVIVLVGALTFFPALLLGPGTQALSNHLFA